MYKVALINMPFAALHIPSIALTQLATVLGEAYGDRLETRIHYLNHDFGRYLGIKRYEGISNSVSSTTSGFGDWLFRQAAFPELEDNTREYSQRYPAAFASAAEKSDLGIVQSFPVFLDSLIDTYSLDRYDLVGFTSMFAQTAASIAMARRLKRRNPSIVTVMGGANCETTMGGVIARNATPIDFAFSGPALKSFPQFVGYMIDGRPEECDRIRGVFSRKSFRMLSGACNEIGEELPIDHPVPLDYGGFLRSLDATCSEVKPVLLFETSRGCWWGEKAHCTFCGLNGTSMNYRAMPADLAIEYINSLFRYYPRVRSFEACDNILPREYVAQVLPHLATPPGASIFYEVKADLSREDLNTLARAGVTIVQPGIEALATSTLKLMKKGTTAFLNLRFLKDCVRTGIDPSWNLLIGFPGEDEQVYRKYVEDLPLLMHLPPPGGAYPVRFDRFSPYFTQAEHYKLKLEPMDFYAMIYPFPEAELRKMAYFLADQNYENEYLANTAQWVKRLEAACRHWNTRWHQRDGLAKPILELVYRGEERVVVDTRYGTTVERSLTTIASDLLFALDYAARLHDVAKKLVDYSTDELESALTELRQLGLVFQEGDKFISVVVLPDRSDVYEMAEW